MKQMIKTFSLLLFDKFEHYLNNIKFWWFLLNLHLTPQICLILSLLRLLASGLGYPVPFGNFTYNTFYFEVPQRKKSQDEVSGSL